MFVFWKNLSDRASAKSGTQYFQEQISFQQKNTIFLQKFPIFPTEMYAGTPLKI